ARRRERSKGASRQGRGRERRHRLRGDGTVVRGLQGPHGGRELLMQRKAKPDVRDTVWNSTPLDLAAMGDHAATVKALLKAGAAGGDELVLRAAAAGKPDLLRAALDAAKVKPETLSAALLLAPADQTKVAELLRQAGAKPL